MKQISVEVQDDHLEKLMNTAPRKAIQELIWNSLDADATEVSVDFEMNEIGGAERLVVRDNGHGLPHREAESAFGHLGGSWKRMAGTTRTRKRFLHGKDGQGRFRAFGLGADVAWTTIYQDGERYHSYRIRGNILTPRVFVIDDLTEVGNGKKSGTVVEITNIQKDFELLRKEEVRDELTEAFAIYLRNYPDVEIIYDGRRIDPSRAVSDSTDYALSDVTDQNGVTYAASLTIIEWNTSARRDLILCDEKGFPLAKRKPGIQSSGFVFTAYLRSDYIRFAFDNGLLEMEEESVPEIESLLESTKECMRSHFRERRAAEASGIIQKWKEEEVYPFENLPVGPVEAAERQVFDILAVNLNAFAPNFDKSDKTNKKLSLNLLKVAIENAPSAVQEMLGRVLSLPEERQRELSELTERVSLEAMITASKTVVDRLDFLSGFKTMLFEDESKTQLLERKQLHRIMADNPWMFGEQYALTLVDDEDLTACLRAHYELLNIEREIDSPVLREDGTKGIVDLMFGAMSPRSGSISREHLVVELKRPLRMLNHEDEHQIISYARAVANDERFDKSATAWDFWLISNRLDEELLGKANQPNRPSGLLYEPRNLPIKVWAKSWTQIIGECESRLKFFRERLEYNASRADGINYLKAAYEKYLPKSILADKKPS